MAKTTDKTTAPDLDTNIAAWKRQQGYRMAQLTRDIKADAEVLIDHLQRILRELDEPTPHLNILGEIQGNAETMDRKIVRLATIREMIRDHDDATEAAQRVEMTD